MTKFLSLAILTIISLTSAKAQIDTVKRWSLNECMVYAIENSPRSKKQELQSRINKQSYNNALASLFPSVEAGVSANFNFGRSIDPETNTYANINSFNNNYGVSAGVTVFNGMRLINTTRAKRVAYLQGLEDAQKMDDDISIETMAAYINVLYYTGMVNLAKEQLAEIENTCHQTRRKEELGMQSIADLAEMEAQVATKEANVTTWENNLRTAELQLKDKMNYPVDGVLVIDSIRGSDINLERESTSEIFSYAKENLPFAKGSEYMLKVSKLEFSAAKGALYPTIRASGGVSTNYNKMINGDAKSSPYYSQFNGNLGEYVQMNLNIPIFDGLYNRSNVRIKRFTMKQQEQTHTENMRLLQSEIQQAVIDMEGAGMEFMRYQKQVTANEIAYKATRRKYDEGMISAIELQTSSNNLLVAKAERLRSRITYITKRRLVNYYKGLPLITPENVEQ